MVEEHPEWDEQDVFFFFLIRPRVMTLMRVLRIMMIMNWQKRSSGS